MANPGRKPSATPPAKCPHCGANAMAIKGKPGSFRCNNRKTKARPNGCGRRFTVGEKGKPGPKVSGKAMSAAERKRKSRKAKEA